eukprot:m.9555 g.9555  ORF g.9555 m.9555 type:complete len:552 (+) comp4084_c0_seq1:545-2200(+)
MANSWEAEMDTLDVDESTSATSAEAEVPNFAHNVPGFPINEENAPMYPGAMPNFDLENVPNYGEQVESYYGVSRTVKQEPDTYMSPPSADSMSTAATGGYMEATNMAAAVGVEALGATQPAAKDYCYPCRFPLKPYEGYVQLSLEVMPPQILIRDVNMQILHQDELSRGNITLHEGTANLSVVVMGSFGPMDMECYLNDVDFWLLTYTLQEAPTCSGRYRIQPTKLSDFDPMCDCGPSKKKAKDTSVVYERAQKDVSSMDMMEKIAPAAYPKFDDDAAGPALPAPGPALPAPPPALPNTFPLNYSNLSEASPFPNPLNQFTFDYNEMSVSPMSPDSTLSMSPSASETSPTRGAPGKGKVRASKRKTSHSTPYYKHAAPHCAPFVMPSQPPQPTDTETPFVASWIKFEGRSHGDIKDYFTLACRRHSPALNGRNVPLLPLVQKWKITGIAVENSVVVVHVKRWKTNYEHKKTRDLGKVFGSHIHHKDYQDKFFLHFYASWPTTTVTLSEDDALFLTKICEPCNRFVSNQSQSDVPLCRNCLTKAKTTGRQKK